MIQMNKKKILHICSYHINDKFYTSFFKHLEKRGFENCPYVFADKRFKNKKNIDNVEVSFCFNTFERMFFNLKHKKVLDDCIRRFDFKDFDFVHAHSLFSNGYIAYKLNELFGIKYVVTVRYPDVLTFFKYMVHLRGLGNKILLNAEHVVFLSENYRNMTLSYVDQKYKKIILDKSSVIPNGVNDFFIKNRSCEKRILNKKKLNVLFVGRINFNKNIKIVIDIVQKLREDGFDAVLNAAGEIESQYLRKYILKYDFVKFKGKCTKEELLKLYRENDIFIMLSHKESFGIVYAEAITQGLPVIYTKGQGFDMQFEEGKAGFCASDKDAMSGVNAVYNILDNYDQISSYCLKNADKFSWDNICLKLKDIYDAVCSGGCNE